LERKTEREPEKEAKGSRKKRYGRQKDMTGMNKPQKYLLIMSHIYILHILFILQKNKRRTEG
jgi:hypothetical protein